MKNRAFKILIVDDSLVDREAYKKYLREDIKFNYTFLEAETIEKAYNIIKTSTPDCILLDYILPDDNGLSLISRISKIEKFSKIPVILLTGQGSEVVAVQAMKSGVSDYLIKSSITEELLKRTLAHTLEKQIMAEQDLTHKQFIRTLVNNIPNPIFYQDSKDEIIECNEAFSSLINRKKSDILGKKLASLISGPFNSENTKHNKKLYETKKELSFEVSFHLKGDDEKYLLISKAPNLDYEGNVAGLISIIIDITSRRKQETHYKELSLNDALTGIPNRRSLNKYIEEKWESMARKKFRASILMIDIDYFKKYNDHYGHQAGDVCLQKVAEALKNSLLRPDDFLARYGGEEFIVILPGTDSTGALTIGRRLNNSVYNLQIDHSKSLANNFLTISIGIYSIDDISNVTDKDAISIADKALYESKNSGRNKITIFEN